MKNLFILVVVGLLGVIAFVQYSNYQDKEAIKNAYQSSYLEDVCMKAYTADGTRNHDATVESSGCRKRVKEALGN